MRRIVIAALVVAFPGALGLALGQSATDAVDLAVERHATGAERAPSL